MTEIHSHVGSSSSTPESLAEWKVGDEFLPFHPDASHVSPDYRDGWNHCYLASIQAALRNGDALIEKITPENRHECAWPDEPTA